MIRVLAALAAHVEHAPRPYRLVVLSDHGQSDGATFQQRFGEGLEDVLARLTGGRASVHGATGPAEHRHGGSRESIGSGIRHHKMPGAISVA